MNNKKSATKKNQSKNKSDKIPKKNKVLKSPASYNLPCSNLEMEKFLDKNKAKLMEHVVNSIDYGVKTNLSKIPVFRFKNTNFVVMLFRESFLENLEQIFDVSLKQENYELCAKIKNIKAEIKKPKMEKYLKTCKMI